MSRTLSNYDDEKLGSTERVEDISLPHLEARIDPAAEKRLVRKLDLILLPQMTLLFLLNFIDRSNIGNANVAGFSKDLKLSVPKYEYNVGLMLFYVAYVLVEIPSNLIMKKIGSIWLCMLTMSLFVYSKILCALKDERTLTLPIREPYSAAICIGTAFIHNFHSFVGVRIALGLAEGGVIPGIVYALTRFYTRAELSFRIGVFLSLGPGLSGAFGGLLAAGFLSSTVKGLHTWQKIFVFEGVITMAFAILFFFTLPTSPESTKWLNEEERELAVTRMKIEHSGVSTDKTTFRMVLKALANPYTWACCLGYNGINVVVQGTSVFLPQIIAGLGKFTIVQTNLRSVGPYLVAAVWSVGISYSSWRYKIHGFLIAGSCVLSVIGYIIFLVSAKPHVLYGAAFLTFSGALPNGPLFLSLATANAGSPTERAIAAAIVPSFGSFGSMASTWLYLPKYAPRYRPGNIVNVCAAILAMTMGAGLSLYGIYENRKRAAGARDHRLEGKSEEEIAALGHKHPRYRLLI
ncbi:uncharacterized protein JCM15063_005348 [Sporobolomyces koalae]|uniref:uncharacterized protein n=1 Tax=Sporobolomyces koalae TaxID=500713 RepID=UPI00316CB07D